MLSLRGDLRTAQEQEKPDLRRESKQAAATSQHTAFNAATLHGKVVDIPPAARSWSDRRW